MFQLPSNARVHREFPLKAVLKNIQADKKAAEDAKNVDKVFVEYVFNEKTTNMKVKRIKEIHIYRIELMDYRVPELFIYQLDKKEAFQVVFILTCDGMEIDLTSPKGLDNTTSMKYATSQWRKEGDEVKLPNTDSLDEFYCFLYGSISDYKPFKGEELEDYIHRSNELKKLDYQISKTEKAIQFERQTKKRLEYNHNLNEYKRRKEELLDPRRLENGKIIESVKGYLAGEHQED